MRAFPVLPDIFNIDPDRSILEILGGEEPLAAVATADGRSLAALVVNASSVETGRDWGHSSADAGPVEPEAGQVAASMTDPVAGLVTFEFDSAAESGPSSPATQGASVPALSNPHADVNFAHSPPADSPGAAAESVPVEAASSARGGPPGGGGGGGGGGGIVTDYKSGAGNGTEGYDIWIQFKGSGWTLELQQAFKNAANYLTTVITDDIGGGGRIGKLVVDDLYVTAEVKTIDGAGGILGQAGPSSVWSASELTAAGQMQFDIADALTYLGKGLWDDIVTHELMHVLGFGSLWNYGDDPLVSNHQYTGEHALDAYQETHPAAAFVPVEDGGGSGTAGAHWDETALINELMTGYINDDGNPANATDNYLSEFSVMSLADLGYQVTYQDYPHDNVIG